MSYNFEVRPVLAAKCFSCHGSDPRNRKGKLRLDQRDAALEKKAFVPGKPEESSIIERVETSDPEEVMPPPDKHQALTAGEIAVLKRWITEGAEYQAHWSFVPPQRGELPAQPGSDALDKIVAAKLNELGMTPSGPAPKEEWLRRVTLALTGLPPTVQEVDAFLADARPDAKAVVVDRLLASPHYGERMAVVWLDSARYGDTYGRHEDADSTVWPWRDWVIKAFNNNLPYDKFLHWQIAGDLIPEAGQEQILATTFQRLPVQSNESGSDPEEFRWDQVFDRVNTFSSAVLGLTMECARCHDHKYDSLTMKDYYGLAAYFDKIDELGLFSRYTNGVPAPTAFVYTGNQESQHAALKQKLQQAEAAYSEAREGLEQRYESWLQKNVPPTMGDNFWTSVTGGKINKLESAFRQPDLYVSFDHFNVKEKVFLADNNPRLKIVGGLSMSKDSPGINHGRACGFNREKPKKVSFPGVANYLRTDAFTFSLWFQSDEAQDHAVILHRSRAGLDAANRGYELTFEEGMLTATLAHFYPGNAIRIQAEEKVDFSKWRHMAMTYDGSSRASGLSLYVDGKRIKTKVIRDNLYRDIDYLVEWGDLDNKKVADADQGNAITLKLGGRTLDAGLHQASIDELRAYNTCLSAPEISWLAGDKTAWKVTDWKDWYEREVDHSCRAAAAALTAARKAENEFATHLTEMMVMKDSAEHGRETRMLNRGDFRQPKDVVEAATPAALGAVAPGAPKNRLGLAQWLTSPQHPLTSRVEVNRIWSLFFGKGLVATPEDFGVQGKVPALPELLDWLSRDFIEGGWDIKAMCRRIALSDTFGRSSIPADPAYRERDPDNAYLARGPRFRLPAEQLRDSALAASGLINPKLGGPSVKPYQPAGLWEDSGTQHEYEQDQGDALYRRSLYTFWRKTCPPPVMSVFDAPTREVCRVRRDSTNTPLQALATMNDTGFLEACRVMAEKLIVSSPDEKARVDQAFRKLTARAPTAVQMDAMVRLLADARKFYAASPEAASTLIENTGESAVNASLQPSEVAATLLMVRAVMNSEPFLASY